jgi:hypothetical protein
MGYVCIFLVGTRCTATASHYFPDEKHIEKYCHNTNACNCPTMVAQVTGTGVFIEGW